jgi:hypothetical protein
MDRPPMGSTIFKGKSNGLSMSLCTVLIRKYWNDSYDAYLRIAVELPEIPRSLIIRPTGRIRRIARLIGFKGSRKNNFPILCADASCLALLPKRRNSWLCQRLGALPDRRLNT